MKMEYTTSLSAAFIKAAKARRMDVNWPRLVDEMEKQLTEARAALRLLDPTHPRLPENINRESV